MLAKSNRSVDLKPCQDRPQALAIRALPPAMKARRSVRNHDSSRKSSQKETRRQSYQHLPNAFATSLSTLTQTASCPDTQTGEPQVDQQSSKPVNKANILRIQARGVFCRLFQSAKRSLALDQQLDRNQSVKAQSDSQRQRTPKPVISHPKKLHNSHLAFVVSQDVWAEQIGSTSPPKQPTCASGPPLRPTKHVARRPVIRVSRTKAYDGGPIVTPDMLAALSDDRPVLNPLKFQYEGTPGCVTTRHIATKIQEPRMNIHQALAQSDAPTMSLTEDSQAAKLKSHRPSRSSQQSPPGPTPSSKDRRCKSAVMKVFFQPIKDDITLNIITCPRSPSPHAGSTLPSPLPSLVPSPAPPPPPPLPTLLQSSSSSSCTSKSRPLQSLALAELDLATDPIANETQSSWYNDLMNSIDQTIGKAAPSVSTSR